MGMPKSAKRSACDRCRAKRVRCPRPEDSMEPCARCVRLAEACVTASAGYPGRPRKAARLNDTPGPAMAGTDASSPAYWATPGDSDDLGLQTPVADKSTSGNTPCGAGDASSNLLGDIGAAAGLSMKPAPHPPNGDAFFHGYSDPWSAHGGDSLFGFPLNGEGSAPDNILATQQLSTMSPHQYLLSGTDSPDVMYTGQDSSGMLDVDFLGSPGYKSSPSPVQRPSTASELMRFGEKIEQRVSAIGAFLSNPRNLVEDCQEDPMGRVTENPVAVLLTCTQEFIDIIHNLMASTTLSAACSSPNQLFSPTASSVGQSASLSTETTLLILSSYLQLMRLYDSLFHEVYRCLSQISSEKLKSIKAKAVFRIGGISCLQDMPGKAYAKGMVGVIQSHIQTLERCMGLPRPYCLSSEEVTASSEGIFADADRARLLHTVMAQEDIKSRRGNKSYVESIRENIKNSVALFGD